MSFPLLNLGIWIESILYNKPTPPERKSLTEKLGITKKDYIPFPRLEKYNFIYLGNLYDYPKQVIVDFIEKKIKPKNTRYMLLTSCIIFIKLSEESKLGDELIIWQNLENLT